MFVKRKFEIKYLGNFRFYAGIPLAFLFLLLVATDRAWMHCSGVLLAFVLRGFYLGRGKGGGPYTLTA